MWTAIGILVFFVVPSAVAVQVLRYVYLEHRRDRVCILLYHRLLSKADAELGRVRDDEIIYVSYDTVFAQQMAWLHENGYTTLDLDDYLKIRSGVMPIPAKPVIITFDDGYLSNYTLAFPALRDRGLKATIFVVLEPDEYTCKLVEGMDGFLTPQHMREMVDHNVSIQSHTLTHCVLAELDDQTALHELAESRRRLAEITRRPVEHIAIPRSGYSRRIRRLVERAGYKTACCNNKGSATGLSDPLALPRIVIERDMSLDDFARCLTPRGAIVLRILGNLKRIPELIGGGRFTEVVRRYLYCGPLLSLVQTRNLKKVMAVCGLLYLAGAILFAWHLLAD